MFCSKCGNEMPEGAVFCSKCGEKMFLPDSIQEESIVPEQPSAEKDDNKSENPDKKKPEGIISKKKSKVPFVIAGSIAAVIVLAAAVTLLLLPRFMHPNEILLKSTPVTDYLERTRDVFTGEMGETSENYQEISDYAELVEYNADKTGIISAAFSKETGKAIYVRLWPDDCRINGKKLKYYATLEETRKKFASSDLVIKGPVPAWRTVHRGVSRGEEIYDVYDFYKYGFEGYHVSMNFNSDYVTNDKEQSMLAEVIFYTDEWIQLCSEDRYNPFEDAYSGKKTELLQYYGGVYKTGDDKYELMINPDKEKTEEYNEAGGMFKITDCATNESMGEGNFNSFVMESQQPSLSNALSYSIVTSEGMWYMEMYKNADGARQIDFYNGDMEIQYEFIMCEDELPYSIGDAGEQYGSYEVDYDNICTGHFVGEVYGIDINVNMFVEPTEFDAIGEVTGTYSGYLYYTDIHEENLIVFGFECEEEEGDLFLIMSVNGCELAIYGDAEFMADYGAASRVYD